jgi:hypothetical protein
MEIEKKKKNILMQNKMPLQQRMQNSIIYYDQRRCTIMEYTGYLYDGNS